MSDISVILGDYNIEVIGYHGNHICLTKEGKKIIFKKSLPKNDLILQLSIEPELVKEFQNEILFAASKRPLTEEEKNQFANLS